MLMGPTFLIDLASAAKPKAEQLLEATEIDNNQSELTIKESTPCLSEHALWSPNRYDFGVKVNLKRLKRLMF